MSAKYPLRSYVRRAHPALAKAARVSSRLRREGDRLLTKARRTGRPSLSVVMPVYNTRDLLPEALESVLSQSFTDLEVLVIDDGSSDGSGDIARSVAARDPRVRVISQPNAGLGASRNRGAELARGEFLTFCDSDDVVLDGAYELMVGKLRRSSSDFVTGVMIRGDNPDEAVRPRWMGEHMGRNRTGLKIGDHPWMLLDITAPNKVFRLSFWRRLGLEFPVGVHYEDQLPLTTAFLKADRFDVVRRPVYLWRIRLDGTSISQQKATLGNLTDRIVSQHQSAPLFDDAPPHVRETWYLKLLDFDFPSFLESALHQDDDYLSALRERLFEMREKAPADAWQRSRFANRSLAWVLSNGDRDSGALLRLWMQQERHGLPVKQIGDELLHDVPDTISEEVLPTHLRRVEDTDVRPVVRLTEVRWRGQQLVLRGSAFLMPLSSSYAEHQLSLTLREPGGLAVEVPLTRHHDERLGNISHRAHEDRADSGFEAVIDATALTRLVPSGQRALTLEFSHAQGRFAATSSITHLMHLESAGSRVASVIDGRMVRLAGVLETGMRVLVHDSFAMLSDTATGPDATIDLTLTCGTADPVVSAHWADARTSDTLAELPFTALGDSRVQVPVAPPTVPCFLRTVHRSGATTRALWGTGPIALGDPDLGAFLHRGHAQTIAARPRVPAVVVSSLTMGPDSLRLDGTSLGAAGRQLFFTGGRADSELSMPLPAGPFSVEVPLRADPWSLGATALPAGTYRLSSHVAGRPDLADDEALHVTTTEVRDTLPAQSRHSGQWVLPSVAGDGTLVLVSSATSEHEGSPRVQSRLQREDYAAARQQPRRPVVLLESFGGKSTGDSPAAIAEELTREHPELDLVWSILDGSVHVPQGARGVHRFSTEWYDLLGSAAYVVNNNNFPHFFTKAPDQIYLQTWHGTPLKKIGNDIPDKRYLSLNYVRTMDAEAAAWDYLVSPSPYCSEIFPRAFGYDGPLLEHGYPRNGLLVRPEGAERAREVRARLGIRPEQQVVLYAPTWRDSASQGKSYAKVLYLDPDRAAATLPDTVILVRGHSNTADAPSVGSSGVIDVTLYPDINDLFLAADVLVTDYSSVMFDFAVLDRPLLFLVPDLEHYRDNLRGFYFDFEREAPGPLCVSEDELLDRLANLEQVEEDYSHARQTFVEKFAPWQDGVAATRVVHSVWGPPER